MKKLIVTLFLCVNVCCLLFAEPADPTPRKVIQPNGDTLYISLHGDEYGSWYEDDKGDIIALNSDNYWVYVAMENEENVLTNQVVSPTSVPLNIDVVSVRDFIMQNRKEVYFEMNELDDDSINSRAITGKKAPLPTTGVQKILTVLVQFPDVKFRDPNRINQEIFNMMNQKNYRHYGQSEITGSLRDFYLQASYGQLDVRTTVIGPYTVSKSKDYYGAATKKKKDEHVRELAREIMEMITADNIVVSQFDNNNDNWVECIHILFAGYAQNDSWGYGTDNDIWPHKWSLATKVNGKGAKMSRYIMTPELNGPYYRGVGTICHELGHILGAPDFYDVKNDVFQGTGKFDLMCDGNWNKFATCPAHPNPYIKTEIFGWTSAVELSGNNVLYTIPPSELYDAIYKISTSTSGEYYLLENRQQKHLPGTGLVIYHVNSGIENVKSSKINIKHRQNLYIVDANNHIEKSAISTPESYGNINSAYATFRDTLSENIYFTSTSLPSNSNWNGDTTYNKDVCFISEENSNGIKFVLNPEIEGPDVLCDSAIYSLKHVPSNATIEWTYIRPSGLLATSEPLKIGSGQGTKAVYYKRGYNLVNDIIDDPIEVPDYPFVPAPASARGFVEKPYSGFVTIKAKITLNGNTFTLSKEIYMPERVVINDVNLGSLGVWYVGGVNSITLRTPTDETILEDIRWDVEYPNGSTQTAYGSSVVVRPDSKGTLTVTATYLNGCGDEYESYTKTFSIVSVINVTFPNPASGSVEISVVNGDTQDESGMRTMSMNNQSTPYMGAYRLELWHDIYGKVREIDVPETTPTVTMNLEGLNSGVYVLRLIIDNQVVEASQLIVK